MIINVPITIPANKVDKVKAALIRSHPVPTDIPSIPTENEWVNQLVVDLAREAIKKEYRVGRDLLIADQADDSDSITT